MKPYKVDNSQDDIFSPRLSRMLNPDHELIKLSLLIPWGEFEEEFSKLYVGARGQPPKPIRLIVGLMMLQHMQGISDEEVVQLWIENPYWQIFCGYDFLQWEFPTDPSSLTRWRQRIGEEGLKKILEATVKTAVKSGAVREQSCKKAIVDTTVMEKNVTFPTDGKLYQKAIQILGNKAKKAGLELRQSYTRVSKQVLRKMNQYGYARQMNRMKREGRRLKTYLGRIRRDIGRKLGPLAELQGIFEPTLKMVDRLLSQKREDSNKLYSLHAPETECIAKGKAHKKYEFGCKVSLVITHKEGLCLSSQALHGSPYDGHTLKNAIKEAEAMTGVSVESVFVDQGYKGHGIEEKKVYRTGQIKGMTASLKRALKRRQAIEPQIGHMKSDGKLGRNFLKGVFGDKANALLAGIGHNLRLIRRWIESFFAYFYGWLSKGNVERYLQVTV